MTTTRTGKFPIGMRRMGGWQDDLDALLAWLKENGFQSVDLGRNGDKEGQKVLDAGLKLGSVDLPDWAGMISDFEQFREKAIEKNAAYIEKCAKLGKLNYFTVMLPENPDLRRDKNFELMIEAYKKLVPTLEKNNGRLIIEGWPGPGCVVCTPEGYRKTFEAIPSKAMGISYDPSHLIRQDIDPIRFLEEFKDRVYHVHGKDAKMFPERLYEYGDQQMAISVERFGYGGVHWRYTIPGHGQMDWPKALEILDKSGYKGVISAELEDQDFSQGEQASKMGLTFSRNFLQSC